MLVMIASAVFGQAKSDSVLVSRIDLIKQIELNDKRKAQWDYCVRLSLQCDSIIVESRRTIVAMDTVIRLKDETINLLTLAKDVAIDNRNEIAKQLKLQKRKTVIKSVGWGVGGGAFGFALGALLLLVK